jgi:predicted transposase YdaD
MAADRRLPDWLSFDKTLPIPERVERSTRWFREVAARPTDEPRAEARARLAEQLEHMRDAVDAAREAGLGWSAIAGSVGLSRRQVKRAFAT